MKIMLVASNMVHVKNFHLPYINAFKEASCDVKVMASGEGADFDIPFKKRAFSLKNFFLSFKIRKILKKEQPDVIYLHTTLASFWTRFAMWGLKNKPIVVNTVHGYLFSEEDNGLKAKLYLMAERLVKNRTDYILVMNKEDERIAIENKLCKKEVFFIDGMGVNISRISNIDRVKKDEDIKKLVFIGEISKRKNQSFLVKALSRLENVHLTLVGDGEERKTLEKLAIKNGVSKRLNITGFTKNVKDYLAMADVYVSASTIEGLPFNIIEAMSASIPIVASDVKGQRDLLPEECLYKLNDMDAFIRCLNNITGDGRSYDVEKYKIENVLDNNVKLYLSLGQNKETVQK